MASKQFNETSSKKVPADQPEDTLYGYHVHIYFDGTEENEQKARRTLARLDAQFPETLQEVHRLGRNVGPHLSPNFSSTIMPEDFGKIVSWLQLHSDGLSILIHPVTNDDMRDHRDCTMWIGTPEALDLSFFEPKKPASKGPSLQ